MSSVAGATATPQATHAFTVVIIDDHLLFADSLALALEASDEISVVAVVGTAADGLAAVTTHHPSVCLLDQRLPDGLGTDLIARLRDASPETEVLLVTGSDAPDSLRRAVLAGASGFVTKGERAPRLLDAVRRAAAGEAVFTAEQLRELTLASAHENWRLGADLTAREREVLTLLAGGSTTHAIAEELYISHATVRNHIQSVLVKLGAHSKLEAVTIAIRESLVDGP